MSVSRFSGSRRAVRLAAPPAPAALCGAYGPIAVRVVCVGGGEGHINVACGRAASPGRGPRARCSSTDLLLTCCGRAARPHSSRRHSCVPRPARPRPREPSARESARPTSAPRCRRSRIAALSLLRFALLAEGPHRLRLPGLSPSPSCGRRAAVGRSKAESANARHRSRAGCGTAQHLEARSGTECRRPRRGQSCCAPLTAATQAACSRRASHRGRLASRSAEVGRRRGGGRIFGRR